MSHIQLRTLDKELHKRLKLLAQLREMTLEKLIVSLLTEVVESFKVQNEMYQGIEAPGGSVDERVGKLSEKLGKVSGK